MPFVRDYNKNAATPLIDIMVIVCVVMSRVAARQQPKYLIKEPTYPPNIVLGMLIALLIV